MSARSMVAGLLVAGVLSVPAHAAARCGSAKRPWVSVDFEGGPWPAGLETSVLGDLSAGLRRRGIDACPESAGPSQPPVAAVRVTRQASESVGVAVEVRDAVTEKRVSRDLDLRRVPDDGRSFAIALAVDELVWASWAELGLRRRRPLPRSAPREVIAGVEKALPLREGSPARLGARAAVERFGGGQTQLGGDALLVTPLAGSFQLDAALGYRRGLSVRAENGRVESNTAAFGLGVRYLVLRSSVLELGAGVSARAAWVRLYGEADPSASDAELAGFALYARGGPNAAIALAGPLWLELGGFVGAPLRGVEASDTGRVVTGVSGLELGAQLAFVVEL